MVTTVLNNMDFAIEVKNNVRTNRSNNKANSDSNFEKILNQEANQSNDKIAAEKDIEKPTTNIKSTNGNKHKIKSSENDKQKLTNTKDDVEEDLNEIEEKITNEVIEALDITREQLDEMLTQLNMTIFDLLSSDKLNTFLMSLYKVEDSLELLTVPNATSNIKELKTGLNELTESYNLEISNLENTTEKIEEIIADVNPKNNVNEQLKTSDETKVTEQSNQEEVSDSNKELPKIEIKDDRTDKSSSTKNDLSVESVSNDSKAFDNVQNITMTQTEVKVEVVDESGQKQILTYNISTEEVIDQIVSSFKVNLTDDANTVYIQLKPEHLGKLALSLTQQEGVVTANFVAENGAVKELIETNLGSLRMALQEQGIVVDKLEVVVNDNSMFNNNNNDSSKQSSHNNDKKRRAAKMMKINSIEEDINNEILDDEDVLSHAEDISSIDYSV
ncbi:hypothetical protein SH1V18_14640 [Vallitalea longa]|uniref:Flagellar hook-length control protein-like C-terminal domain-containing protein n=1 Tax=Vallitalea longa TaxID=2936439 RepID=A0A9W6DFR5_9FIRM|nr:flagellar hook-length control protein FliK [Vallitalea longa]GKX28984.1 hypothetical protein SH1V18_14640 [Vallitalea longa]